MPSDSISVIDSCMVELCPVPGHMISAPFVLPPEWCNGTRLNLKIYIKMFDFSGHIYPMFFNEQ